MKKIDKFLAISLIAVMSLLTFSGCIGSKDPEATATAEITVTTTPAPTEPPADIDPSTVDVITQQWVATEISFVSSTEYTKPLDDAQFDVIFTAPDGSTLVMPGFWDGDTTWKVRFAPTACGVWTYKTSCSDTANTGLNAQEGKIGCNAYKGDLAIYQHGFIKTQANVKYFMYADGTPFFYLGDTHWNLAAEEYDSSKVDGIASHFKYIVDKRVEQGFTVYQSEPIGTKYSLGNGFSKSDIKGFQEYDQKFQYLAEKGLVHANAQLFFANELAYNGSKYSDDYLEKLSRYWVARYAAYPVLWTTAQEVDNDFYYEADGSQKYFDANSNPWKKVAAAVYKYDPYKHPGTAHQENTGNTTATNSSFRDLECHKWYGAQWSPRKNGGIDFAIPQDYWNNGQGKPVVNYEGHYDHLWTNHFGARMQGWTAYLNGMFGYGYGAIDIWLYNSTYDMKEDSNVFDIITTVEDKKVKWNVSVDFESAYQVGYMRQFFLQMEWWKLVPCFNDISGEHISIFAAGFSAATIASDVYVVYFYNTDTTTGKLSHLESGKTYTAKWYNPRTNEYVNIATDITGTGEKSYWEMPAKPDAQDWVIYVTKNN